MRPRHFTMLLALLVFTHGCEREATEPDADAGVEAGVEAMLTGRVHLSLAAQESIGLKTTVVKHQFVAETITTAGWLLVKPGNEIQIKAAATGFLMQDGDSKQTDLGRVVTDRQELGKLHIFLSPQEEAQLVALKEDADILIEQSLASLAIAEDRYGKVKNIEGVLAGKDLQALQEVVRRSRAAVEQARDKLPFLPSEPYERPLRLDDVAIKSPISGRIMAVHVRPRQLVVQGDPLWTVADWSALWVKATVFEGDLPKIDQSKAIVITVPGAKVQLQAQATGVLQPTDGERRTVDLLYEVPNDEWRLRPGQPVSAAIPTSVASERLVIPPSALLWDGMGNTWVYVRENSDTFRRQRAQVGADQQGVVAVKRGLSANEEVVVIGAEALFGQEFKSQIEVEDED